VRHDREAIGCRIVVLHPGLHRPGPLVLGPPLRHFTRSPAPQGVTEEKEVTYLMSGHIYKDASRLSFVCGVSKVHRVVPWSGRWQPTATTLSSERACRRERT